MSSRTKICIKCNVFLLKIMLGDMLLYFPGPIPLHIVSSQTSHSLKAKLLYNIVHCFKGSLTRDFRLLVFFMNQCPPGPQVFHWGRFECFQKFAETFVNEYLSPVSLTPVINCSAVSTTPAINPCHGEITKKPKKFSKIHGDIRE